jgi:hypothetical protein
MSERVQPSRPQICLNPILVDETQQKLRDSVRQASWHRRREETTYE